MEVLTVAKAKLKLLYLAKIFMEETDDQHPLTMSRLIEKLGACGITADRKTLYLDLEELRRFGMDIIGEQDGRSYHYYLGARRFELPELKLLVDSVQSAKFMTGRKSSELIRKLESLVSVHQAKQLHRQVVISGRVKTMNESIYYNVDRIHEAIGEDRQIRFQYYQWNIRKEMELRRGGAWYKVSPWALLWDDENYYLVGYDAADDKIKHFRVDKMLRIGTAQDTRLGKEKFREFNMPGYTRSLFGMFGGEEVRITLEADNSMIGVLIDRFGKEIPVIPHGPDRFRTMVTVAVSQQFFGWIMAMGGGVRIVSPPEVVSQMRDEIEKIRSQYEDA